MTARNLLTAWADLVLGTLSACGVRDVVVSPGSRSTPFALAAARRPELTVRAVIDERAAAFSALGLARASGRPPLLICTSGTAPAHYYPAVIEASEASIPLVVLSADRPTELVAAGAPQTTDQVRLYGTHVRGFVDLGDPDASSGALRGARRRVAQLVAEALGPDPGPVHLDARARKPLEPIAPETDEERALAAQVAELLERAPRIEAPRLARPDGIGEVARRLDEAERPAIVAGPLGLASLPHRGAVLAFAARRDVAVCAEASSQLRFGPRPDTLVAGDAFDLWIAGAAPDLVLELGATPTSSAYARWLATDGPRHRFVLGGTRVRDPAGTADAVLLGDVGDLFTSLDERCPATARPAWRATVERAETDAWRAIDHAVDEASARSPDGEGAASPDGEGAATRAVIDALPPETQLLLGNSLPIRHADRFVRGGGRRLRVITQRGVNGIDGWIAGAAGAAAVGPTVAIIGDVTFAHDVGALGLATATPHPVVLVLLDNAGGRIFERLPIAGAGLDAASLALFTTPPAIDFEAAARAFGARYAAPDVAAIGRAVQAALERPGATVLHVRVPPHGAAETERRITDALPAHSTGVATRAADGGRAR